jgi:hypothetical protein
MMRIGVRLRIAADGAVASGVGATLVLPVFVLMGGHPGSYLPIALANVACVVAVTCVAGGLLARPLTPDRSVVARATAVAVASWLITWTVATGLGIIGILSGAGTLEHHLWQLVGLLMYAVATLVLLSLPAVTALATQLSLTMWLHRHPLQRSRAGGPSRA